jgi:hypothetical protein
VAGKVTRESILKSTAHKIKIGHQIDFKMMKKWSEQDRRRAERYLRTAGAA